MNDNFFKELRIEHISNPKLKHSYISIKPNYNPNAAQVAKIVLKTPKVSQDFIHELLLQREQWMRKQILKFQKTKPKEINLEDEVLLFGEIYSLDSQEAKPLREKLAKIPINAVLKIENSYNLFYLELSQEYLPKRVEYFAQIMRLEYRGVVFKKFKSKWGSCDSKKIITLNTQLMKVQKELIDYVIVHELAHLVHMNHSKAFHAHVEKYLPFSQKLRSALKNTHL
ncbi:MAG: SprT family zinc-dependent metalloprotease [Sulfurimonas sp.]